MDKTMAGPVEIDSCLIERWPSLVDILYVGPDTRLSAAASPGVGKDQQCN